MRAYMKLTTATCHVDCGANSFMFTKREYFWKYQEITVSVCMGDGNFGQAIGIGIVLIRFSDLPVIFPLYPCYHMPNNPQHTFSPTAMKQYLHNVKSVRYEASL